MFDVWTIFVKTGKSDSAAALTDMEAHILEAQLTKGRVSNSPCYKAETWDNSFCETPKALLEKNRGQYSYSSHSTCTRCMYRIPIKKLKKNLLNKNGIYTQKPGEFDKIETNFKTA